MADNEERIIIAIAEPSLLEGGADKIYPCMTRQEAIEIMAQAICMSNADGCGRRCLQGNCCYYVEREKEAKAALNALLRNEK